MSMTIKRRLHRLRCVCPECPTNSISEGDGVLYVLTRLPALSASVITIPAMRLRLSGGVHVKAA